MAAKRVHFRLSPTPTAEVITADDNEYGVDATADELALLRKIDRDNERAGRLQGDSLDDPGFGGTWFDRDRNVLVTAVVAGQSQTALRAQASQAGFELPVDS